MIVIVLNKKTLSQVSRPQAVGIIAHEAVHFMSASLEHIGEETPGEEMKAYVTQWATQIMYDQLYTKPSSSPSAKLKAPSRCGAEELLRGVARVAP